MFLVDKQNKTEYNLNIQISKVIKRRYKFEISFPTGGEIFDVGIFVAN